MTNADHDVPTRGQILGVAPGMPTRDMARTAAHYRRMGFTFGEDDADNVDGEGFAIAQREGFELHFALKPEHDPATTAMWVYCSVADVAAIAAEFAAAGVERSSDPYDTDYKMRELACIDPDGNMLLFGSPFEVSGLPQ